MNKEAQLRIRKKSNLCDIADENEWLLQYGEVVESFPMRQRVEKAESKLRKSNHSHGKPIVHAIR